MKKLKKVNERQFFSEIPSALLWEVLGRVSIKACLACKLVCKEWYRIVLSPEFSSFRHHCMPSRFTILFYKNVRGDALVLNLVEIDKSFDVGLSRKCTVGVDHLVSFKPNINPSDKISYVKSHCDGIVRAVSTSREYFICKLLTGECVKLLSLDQVRNPSSCISCFELGCSSVSSQIKVLILLWDVWKKIQQAKIQTLGNGEWRSVDNAPSYMMMDGCFMNGSSHWVGGSYILSFHFGEEMFSQMPFRNDETVTKHYKRLSIRNSCLCLSCVSTGVGVEVEIWVMKEYGVKDSWV